MRTKNTEQTRTAYFAFLVNIRPFRLQYNEIKSAIYSLFDCNKILILRSESNAIKLSKIFILPNI